jgi:hypothetical protein
LPLTKSTINDCSLSPFVNCNLKDYFFSLSVSSNCFSLLLTVFKISKKVVLSHGTFVLNLFRDYSFVDPESESEHQYGNHKHKNSGISMLPTCIVFYHFGCSLI